MPKVPKTVPKYIGTFFDFAKKGEKREQRTALDQAHQIFNDKWDAFQEMMAEAEAERPKKQRKVDPLKTLATAAQKAAQQVNLEDAEQVQAVRNTLKEALPEVLNAESKVLEQTKSSVELILADIEVAQQTLQASLQTVPEEVKPGLSQTDATLSKIQSQLETVSQSLQESSEENAAEEEEDTEDMYDDA